MSLKRTSSPWLCLEEGPDASGKPLIRSCSCRGGSGWAHLSLVLSNMLKMRAGKLTRGANIVHSPSGNVLIVNRSIKYQGDVQYALAKAGVEFIEREYKNNHKLYLDALIDKIYSLDFKDEQQDRKGGKYVRKCSQ
jgi:hypothetical protein